jgi:hypothetical protein
MSGDDKISESSKRNVAILKQAYYEGHPKVILTPEQVKQKALMKHQLDDYTENALIKETAIEIKVEKLKKAKEAKEAADLERRRLALRR